MHSQPTLAPPAGTPRVDNRTNMFVAAVLHAAGPPAPVRIRNMSPTGAMIEGPVVPPAGTPVRLVRGSLAVDGELIWSAGNRCGLRFASTVLVREWMATPPNREQQRVDAIVGLTQSGIIARSIVPPPVISQPVVSQPVVAQALSRTIHDEPRQPMTSLARDAQTATDLDQVCRLLGRLGDDLASHPETLRRHAAKLQFLDIADQMLVALAATFRPDAAGDAAGSARLDDLRKSCTEALKSA